MATATRATPVGRWLRVMIALPVRRAEDPHRSRRTSADDAAGDVRAGARPGRVVLVADRAGDVPLSVWGADRRPVVPVQIAAAEPLPRVRRHRGLPGPG